MLPTDTPTSTTAQGGGTLSRLAAGNVAVAVAGSSKDALTLGSSVTVALLKGGLTYDTTSGAYTGLGTWELDSTLAPGYTRITLPRATGWTGPTGSAPVVVSNTAQAVSGIATADWPAVNGFALLDASGNVLTWRPLATPLYVKLGQVARIPIGGFLFAVPSL